MDGSCDPPQNTFVCDLCGLSTPFTYFGQKPPNTRAIVLLEECFVTRDPFSPDKERFLVLGSKCNLCDRCVCVAPDCSLFYTTRFCTRCVSKHLEQFPAEVQSEVAKRKCLTKQLEQFPSAVQSEVAKKKKQQTSKPFNT